MSQCLHYRRIHARVWRAAWSNLSPRVQHVIANDALHVSEDYKWFEKKVSEDAQRIFEDANYYDNDKLTFQYSNEQLNNYELAA